jgi:hypothetical protein
MPARNLQDDTVSDHAWRHFIGGLSQDVEQLAEEIAEREASRFSSYSRFNDVRLAGIACDGLSGLLPLLYERRSLRDDELARYWSTSERQAKNGVTLDDQLQAWHVGLDALRTWARCRIVADELPAEVMLEFLDWTIPWMELGSTVTIDYYREQRVRSGVDAQRAQRTFVRGVLAGTLARQGLLEGCRRFAVDPARSYCAVRARVAGNAPAYALRDWVAAASRRAGLVAAISDEVWGFVDVLPEDCGELVVGTSPAVGLNEIARGFALATRALETAVCLGLTGRHEVPSLGLHPAILKDDEVGDSLIDRYVTQVEALGHSGDEILKTVRAYLSSHSQPDRVAAELYVHPNTVRYRLRRYEEITGSRLRDASSLTQVWWAFERHRLLSARGL